IGLFLLKHIYGLSDEGVCERWVYDPYFQHFTGEEFFQHEFPHERSDLSHWRKRLGGKLELLLAESLRWRTRAGASDEGFGAGHGRYHRAAQGHHLPNRCEAFARRDHRWPRCHTQQNAERARNGYKSQASAPGSEPSASARPKHTENSNALSGATP